MSSESPPRPAATTGFIGLGNIGAPMARRLAEAADLVVHDAMPRQMERFCGVARLAATPAEVGRQANIVSLCVRDGHDTEAVIFGPDGLATSMAPGSIILIHSTVDAAQVRDIAARAANFNIHVLDAAITGGPVVAAQGGLCVMIGGDAQLVERVQPVLAAFANRIIHAGACGAGISLKICNNLLTYSQIVATAEAIGLMESCSLDSNMLVEVMRANGNLTPVLKMYVEGRSTARAGKESKIMAPEQAASIAEKDLDLAVALGQSTGFPTPASGLTRLLIRKAFLPGSNVEPTPPEAFN